MAKSRTRLSDFTFTFHFHALEKEMATHSSVLAWRIPGTGKRGDSETTKRNRRAGEFLSQKKLDLAKLKTYALRDTVKKVKV